MPVPALINPLEKGRYYHIYNRGNNKEHIFKTREDYYFFLGRYSHYLDRYLKTYAYCLMPNHFHFLVYVEEESGEDGSNVSNQFRKLFISHARRINYRDKRSGCLLTRNFRRVKIDNHHQLKAVVKYIHYNPVKHGVSRNIIKYPYSSFGVFLNMQHQWIDKKEVLEWFDGYEQFLMEHHLVEKEGETEFPIEDDL